MVRVADAKAEEAKICGVLTTYCRLLRMPMRGDMTRPGDGVMCSEEPLAWPLAGWLREELPKRQAAGSRTSRPSRTQQGARLGALFPFSEAPEGGEARTGSLSTGNVALTVLP